MFNNQSSEEEFLKQLFPVSLKTKLFDI